MILLRIVAFSLSCCCKFDGNCRFNEYCVSVPVNGKDKLSEPCSRFRLSFLKSDKIYKEYSPCQFKSHTIAIILPYISELLTLLALILAVFAEHAEFAIAVGGSVIVFTFPESRFCRE